MTARRVYRPVVVGLGVWLILLTAGLRAQDGLARAKDLYLSAAYDEALVVLDQLKVQRNAAAASPANATEVEQYRVFCLLALDRRDEAQNAIEDILTVDPFYRPSETQTSPRIRSVFQETRKAILPGFVQRTYAGAKMLFEKKDPKALAQFELVLALLDDPELKGTPQLDDLRTVVSGFRDLSKALTVLPAAPLKPSQAALPAQAEGGAPPSATVVDAPPDRSAAPGFTPPVVISQPIPRWIPPNTIDRQIIFKGLIEVSIDENGNVTSATIKQSVHPLYDDRLLAMARTWKYKPALRNNVPTSSVKVVEIRLQPR